MKGSFWMGSLVVFLVAIVLGALAIKQATAAGQADLVPLNFSVNSTPNGTNFTVQLKAVIKNIGNATANATTTRFRVTPIGGNKNVATGTLVVGATENEQVLYYLPAGTYNASVTADINNVVNESNEGNNVATLTFTI